MKTSLMVMMTTAAMLTATVAVADNDLVPGQVLVKPAHSITNDASWHVLLRGVAARSSLQLTLVRQVQMGWALVAVRDADGSPLGNEETAAAVSLLSKDVSLANAAPNGWKRIQRVPNDPLLNQMWHLNEVNAAEAWDVTTGLSSQRIGIIDTGLVRNHEDVGNRAVTGFDFVSSFNTANDGDARDPEFADPGDDCGGGNSWHGTHVAGTIGANTDNGTGIAGMNWSAGLVIARALGRCGGDTVDIMDAMSWLAGLDVAGVGNIGANKVSVMNLSLGGFGECTGYEQDIVNATIGQGVVVVAATGNDGGAVNSPGNCSGVITVAAFGPDRGLTNYSSFGPSVDVVGPGGALSFGQSGGVLSSLGPNASDYAFYEGTSMAAPHVAGVVSLMQARNSALTTAELITLLQQNGDSCANCNGVPALNAARAVAAVVPGEPPPPPPPPPTDDALEDNDAASAAAVLGCGSSLSLMSLDEDWFRIGTTGLVQINVDGGSSDQVDLFLFATAGGDPLATSATESGVEAISTTVAAGEYYVAVTPFNGGGPYSLSLNCTGIDDDSGTPTDPVDPGPGGNRPPPTPPGPAVDDDLEDNDDAPAARYLGCRNRSNLQLLDDDWFVVDAREGDKLRVAASSGTITLEQNGAVLGTGTGEVVVPAVGAGDVLVHLTPNGGSSSYRLQVGCGDVLVAPTAVGGCQSSLWLPGWLPLLAVLFHRRRQGHLNRRVLSA